MIKEPWFSRLLFILFLILLISDCKKEFLPEVVTGEVEVTNTGIWKIYIIRASVISEGSGPVYAKGICLSTNTKPSLSDTTTVEGPGAGDFAGMFEAEKLTSQTTYYARAYATNSIGTSYGNEISFTTPCILFSGLDNIYFFAESPVDGATGQFLDFYLRWETYSPERMNYDLYLGTNSNPDSIIARDISTGYFELRNLKVNTTYYWKVFAHSSILPCSNNTSAVWNFKTVPELSPPMVTTSSIAYYTSNAAIAGGEVTSQGGMEVTESGIFWGSSPDPETTGTRIINRGRTGVFQTVLSDLNPSTTYYIKAYASNSLGTNYGSQVSFMTESPPTGQTVSDIDGNVYKTINLGSQVWMTENLKTKRFNDGTEIARITLQSTNDYSYSGAYSDYNYDITNSSVYGRLYNWYTVKNGNLCPTGWHVPSDDEWTILENFLVFNGYNYDGSVTENKIAISMVWPALWKFSSNQGSPGNIDFPQKRNISGFTALPAGKRLSWVRSFAYQGELVQWWTSTESNGTDTNYQPVARSCMVANNSSNLYRITTNRMDGISVRCVKN